VRDVDRELRRPRAINYREGTAARTTSVFYIAHILGYVNVQTGVKLADQLSARIQRSSERVKEACATTPGTYRGAPG
jgi:hypothetical protein